MNNNLRKVIFKLGRYEYHPSATDEEKCEMEEWSKERRGYFHRWVEDVDCSGEIPRIKVMALVEDADSGKIHEVETYNVTFTRQWQ